MFETLKRHWPEYLMEAAGLAGFMICAALWTIALEHPDSPVRQALDGRPVLRRVPPALGLGAYIAALVYSPWGRRSGAHINPAVTLAFFRLGKIKPRDAACYLLAQFAGAIATGQLLKLALGAWFSHPVVHMAATVPGSPPHATALAFAGEFVITFVLMLVVLIAINSERLERFAGLFTGLLLALYLVFEAPLSGMSMNPARSLGSGLAARDYTSLWVYFTAPPLATLLAAELFRAWRRGQEGRACAKLYHRRGEHCIFCDHKSAPHYPVEAEAAT